MIVTPKSIATIPLLGLEQLSQLSFFWAVKLLQLGQPTCMSRCPFVLKEGGLILNLCTYRLARSISLLEEQKSILKQGFLFFFLQQSHRVLHGTSFVLRIGQRIPLNFGSFYQNELNPDIVLLLVKPLRTCYRIYKFYTNSIIAMTIISLNFYAGEDTNMPTR